MNEEQISQVRRFNRTITHRLGVLSNNYLDIGLPLGEARLLFEIGPTGATIRELRTRLSLDSGYLSRMVRALEAKMLVKSQPDPADARVRRLILTSKGKRQWAVLDKRSQEKVTALLEPLGASQRIRMLTAMNEIERLMQASSVVIKLSDPSSETAHSCIQSYFTELQALFDEGFDPRLTVSANPEELVPPRGWFLMAYLDEIAVGCGALKVNEEGYGEIKRMWVAPSARGLGIAQRLLEALEKQAKTAGLKILRLDTHRNLKEARQLYFHNDYREIPPYNANPYAHHWFEKEL